MSLIRTDFSGGAASPEAPPSAESVSTRLDRIQNARGLMREDGRMPGARQLSSGFDGRGKRKRLPVKFHRGPASAGAFEDLAADGQTPVTVLYADIRIDRRSTTTIQCEDSSGAPRRQVLREAKIEEEYDLYKAGGAMTEVKGTSLGALRVSDDTAETLRRHGIGSVEDLVATPREEIERLFGVNIGSSIHAYAQTYMSQQSADARRTLLSEENRRLETLIEHKDAEIKELLLQAQKDRDDFRAQLEALQMDAGAAKRQRAQSKRMKARSSRTDPQAFETSKAPDPEPEEIVE